MKSTDTVLNIVKSRLRVSPADVVKASHLSEKAVFNSLNNLVKAGSIWKFGKPPEVYYSPTDIQTPLKAIELVPYNITKGQQIKELTKRVPPIVNICPLIHREGKFLFGRRNYKKDPQFAGMYMFPGGRQHFDESPEDAALRIIAEETPGIEVTLRHLVAVLYGKGFDRRANGISIYYLFDFISGNPKSNFQFDGFKWLSKDEILNDENIYPMDRIAIGDIDNELRWMNTSQDELIVEVDGNDTPIGYIPKRTAHASPDRYHRAAHIMIFNSKGQVVLHKRSKNKSLYPGYWDMFGGHQIYGHTIDQTAKFETTEELGIAPKLKYHNKYLLELPNQKEFAYLYYGVSDGPYDWDTTEVETVDVFEPVDVILGKYNGRYEILSHVVNHLQELEEVWRNL